MTRSWKIRGNASKILVLLIKNIIIWLLNPPLLQIKSVRTSFSHSKPSTTPPTPYKHPHPLQPPPNPTPPPPQMSSQGAITLSLLGHQMIVKHPYFETISNELKHDFINNSNISCSICSFFNSKYKL